MAHLQQKWTPAFFRQEIDASAIVRSSFGLNRAIKCEPSVNALLGLRVEFFFIVVKISDLF